VHHFTALTHSAGRGGPIFACDLIEYPTISFLDPVLEPHRWFPIQVLTNQGVVGIPSAHAFGSVKIVPALQLYTGNAFYDVDELIDGDKFRRTKINRFDNIAVHDLQSTLYAIVDVRETPSLFAVTPDFVFVMAC
jgi:hypothetical protein